MKIEALNAVSLTGGVFKMLDLFFEIPRYKSITSRQGTSVQNYNIHIHKTSNVSNSNRNFGVILFLSETSLNFDWSGFHGSEHSMEPTKSP